MVQILQDISLEEQNNFWEESKFIKKKTNKPIIIKIEKDKKEHKFKCRICGHTKYEGVYGDSIMTPIGGGQYLLAYQCSNCSVIFKYPKKFTKSD